jgi:uncharacterized membrane protein YfcA
VALVYIMALLATGVGVGFASGFLGVGGGFIMTPVQYWIFTAMGVPTDVAIKLAFGTTLLAILPTAASGVWRHHRMGAVWWRAAIIMGCSGLAGGFAGATLAAHLPGAGLKIAFGVAMLAAGIRMLTAKPVEVEEEPEDRPWLWAAWAIPINIVTTMIGIGGGVLMVPVMVLVFKFKMHRAVATSLAFVMIANVGGIIGYIVNGRGVPNLPPHSIGYVNLLAWALLAATSVGMAQVGAITAHRLPARQLRYVFVGVMVYMGLRMLGAFG